MLSGNVSTLWFKPPEILLGDNSYGFSVDIWAAGCLFYFMSHFIHLFKGDNQVKVLTKIFTVLNTPHEESSFWLLPKASLFSQISITN